MNQVTIDNFDKAVSFIKSIGIQVSFSAIAGNTVLPGITIENGGIIIDKDQLKYPGDVLHDAGHIAVVPASERSAMSEAEIHDRKDHAAEEMMAIAWSYAACIHLGIDPAFVFHDEGYKGQAIQIVDGFSQGHYLALPMLQWVGMALERKSESEPELPIYPAMLRWLRE